MNTCRLCKGNDITLIHKGTRDRSDIDVLRCNDCGLVFLSKIATDDWFYTDSQMREKIDFDKWRENTSGDDGRRFSKYRELMAGKTVLDFGCGNGGFLKLIQTNMHGEPGVKRAAGMELDAESVQRLREDGIECYGSLAELPDVRFDLIFMFHVIEHLSDPETVLRNLADRLSDEGMIVIETPNADDALLSIYHCEKFADFTYWSPHIYLYNEDTLRKILERTGGLDVVEILQEQRYPLANHLRWLAKGLPAGGVAEFRELNVRELNDAYAETLRRQKACDTLVATVRRELK